MTHPLLQTPGQELAIAETHAVLPEAIQRRGVGLPAPIEDLEWTANMLAKSGIAAHLFNQPGRCLAVAYAAARLDMDAVGFASKTYFTPVKGGGERMSYEAQLVVAILYKLAPLVGRLDIEYAGQGAQRHCIVTGRIKGVRKPKRYVSPILGMIKPKNSPLWFTDPDQQLAYYSQRAWGRRYTPEALMGVYSPDEFSANDNMDELEAAIRADPFDESELGAAEPSGGVDFVKALKDMRSEPEGDPGGGRDSQGGHRGGGQRRQEKPKEPAKGDEVSEPEDMPELRQWAHEQQSGILGSKVAAEAHEAWDALIKEPRWGRLKAYNLSVANAIKGVVAAHIAALKKAEQDALPPGLRENPA